MGEEQSQSLDEIFDMDRIVWQEVVNQVNCPLLSTDMDIPERRRQLQRALNHMTPWNNRSVPLSNPRNAQTNEHSLQRRRSQIRRAIYFMRQEIDPETENNNRNNVHLSPCRTLNPYRSTVRVCIGTETFWCIPSLLQLHSKFFKQHFRRVNRFREGADLTAMGFRIAYDWMKSQEALDKQMKPDLIMLLIHTAMQLEMELLEMLCYQLLCSSHFHEKIAFDVYLAALKYPKLEGLRKLMLQRIGVHFLAIVGGQEFLQMPLEDVMSMLQQNNLGVNSELEVLLSVIKWLAHRPADIPKAMPQIIDCVRFTLLPLSVLHKLWLGIVVINYPLDRNEALGNAFRNDIKLQERISNAIAVSQLRLLYQTRQEFVECCRSKDIAVEGPREWLYDEHCTYHLAEPKAPYNHLISGPAILLYASQRAEGLIEPLPRRSILPTSNDLQTIPEVPEEESESDSEIESDGELTTYSSSDDSVSSDQAQRELANSIRNTIERRRRARRPMNSVRFHYSDPELSSDNMSSDDEISEIRNYADSLMAHSANESLFAGNANDSLFGGNANNSPFGRGSNYSLLGRNGNDSLFGGNANDSLFGGNDNDSLFGGNDNDSLLSRSATFSNWSQPVEPSFRRWFGPQAVGQRYVTPQRVRFGVDMLRGRMRHNATNSFVLRRSTTTSGRSPTAEPTFRRWFGPQTIEHQPYPTRERLRFGVDMSGGRMGRNPNDSQFGQRANNSLFGRSSTTSGRFPNAEPSFSRWFCPETAEQRNENPEDDMFDDEMSEDYLEGMRFLVGSDNESETEEVPLENQVTPMENFVQNNKLIIQKLREQLGMKSAS
ncbi:uncharacterized protein LOC108103526 [Drosophila eugracilis]|uniref:uncharacterized protein LOC108103526 n=1 Tax=Drosophila eugracilis TaxID=29029 RepID=UPI0007E85D60|nr:uncharacterized protein LOC108103526 [Drosophila eugracilis]XP_017064528.1 uncharacterized protein LOC108103526 [Drosophila eugracilis]